MFSLFSLLPFYSSVLTPKEQEEIETVDLEEFNEELGKVRFHGPKATT